MVEYRFAELLWNHAPIQSGELVKLCGQGLFENRDGTVHVLISRENYAAMQSEKFVEENFSGSLPAFLAAFTARKKLSGQELREIRGMIEAMGGQGNE